MATTDSKTTTRKKSATSKRAPAGGKAQPRPATPRKAQTRGTTDPKNLRGGHAKHAWIYQQIQSQVEKTGTNTHHGYDYFQEHGVLGIVKPLVVECNAGVLVEYREAEADGNHSRAVCVITVYDPSLSRTDPDWGLGATFPCEGIDSQDKGYNKLMTNGAKYAYQKMFGIPTEALPDSDDDTDEPTTSTSSGSKRTSKPASPVTVAPAKAAALRQIAGKAVDDKVFDGNTVTAYLTAEFGKSKITDLTPQEGDAFEAWLLEHTTKEN